MPITKEKIIENLNVRLTKGGAPMLVVCRELTPMSSNHDILVHALIDSLLDEIIHETNNIRQHVSLHNELIGELRGE